MYIDINIADQKKSVLINTGASNLFISENVMCKLGVLVRESTKKIKIFNSKEVSTVDVSNTRS